MNLVILPGVLDVAVADILGHWCLQVNIAILRKYTFELSQIRFFPGAAYLPPHVPPTTLCCCPGSIPLGQNLGMIKKTESGVGTSRLSFGVSECH